MASGKKRHKADKAKKKAAKPAAGPFRHPDGDRRHRSGSDPVRDALAAKAMLRLIGAPEPPAEG